jgi:hypothetical protein
VGFNITLPRDVLDRLGVASGGWKMKLCLKVLLSELTKNRYRRTYQAAAPGLKPTRQSDGGGHGTCTRRAPVLQTGPALATPILGGPDVEVRRGLFFVTTVRTRRTLPQLWFSPPLLDKGLPTEHGFIVARHP